MSAVKNALGRSRSAVARAVKAPWRKLAEATRRPREAASGLLERARQRPRYTIAIAAAVLLGLAWIGWAIYVTAENGAAAGIGVLLSWPVLLGALALIAAPFVLTAMLVQRHRDSTPAIAGAPAVSDPPKPNPEKEAQKVAAEEAEEKGEKAPEAEAEGEEDSKAPAAEEDPAASSS